MKEEGWSNALDMLKQYPLQIIMIFEQKL